MDTKKCIDVLRERIMPGYEENAELKDAVLTAVNALKAVEKCKDLIFKYRCSAVTMRNQKTYFTEHDVGYCEGTLDVFEETERDIESMLKEYKLL